jgi:aspartate carbamoyltransferase catalytic subunit
MKNPNDVIEAVRGRDAIAADRILAALFYEPSTRTRLSFESAMIRLGGHVITAADAKTTSGAKAETIADTVRVVQNYADVIVIRHPSEGAARVAADCASVPVVNARDGAHEHPTQTLCDLFVLTRGDVSLQCGNVLICGDLTNRTVHSLVYGLARFGANILFRAAPGFELPIHVSSRPEREYGLSSMSEEDFRRFKIAGNDIGGIYATPEGANQLTLIPAPAVESSQAADFQKYGVCYVPRLEMARLEGSEFSEKKTDRSTEVVRPAPLLDQPCYESDGHKAQNYMRQAAYGVPVRMALLAGLLRERPDVVDQKKPVWTYPGHEKNVFMICPNPKCILHDPNEKKYLTKKFWIIKNTDAFKETRTKAKPPYLFLRCYYCEDEVVPEFVGGMSTRAFTDDLSYYDSLPEENVTFFANAHDPRDFGFRYFQFKDQ